MAKATAITDAKRTKLLKLLREGSRRGAACTAVGISYHTFRTRMKSDSAFAVEVVEAEAEANELVEDALFSTAIAGNTTAQMFWLSNRDPERWMDRRKQDLHLDGKVEHEHDVRNSLESKLNEIAARVVSDE